MKNHTPIAVARMVFLVLAVLFLAGCTPEKAKSIRLAAEQFSVQALMAVNALEKAMEDELAPRPRSAGEQTDLFVDFLVDLDLAILAQEGIELGFAELELAARPDAFELDPRIEKARNRYLNGLRARYAAFAGMLQGLELGSFFAADALERANEMAARLTADMAGIARHFKTHPPQLIQHRASLVADTLDILENPDLAQASKQDRLALIKTRFDEIYLSEKRLLHSVLEPSLKAAELGLKLHEMAAGYERLSVGDMQDMLLRSIRIVGSLTGRDLKSLSRQADAVFANIQNDPVLNSVANQAVAELNKAIAGP